MSRPTAVPIRAVLLLVVVIVIALISGMSFRRLHVAEPVPLGLGVTDEGKLSDYNPRLLHQPSDTPVFYLKGAKPGGTMILLGGVHSNEIAGVIAASIVLENAIVEAGQLIIIPRSNASGFTHNAPGQAVPQFINIPTAWGSRSFRYGDRLANPLHQFPDPDAHIHPQSGSVGHGSEARNLNRNFPGVQDGTLIEQVAWAITELTRENRADMLLDMHEARPMNPIVDALIVHERAREVGSFAILDMQMLDGVRLRLEPSPAGFRGLTHREIGDVTDAMTMLAETPNVAMDNLRGPTNERLVLDGIDEFVGRAARHRGLIYAEYDEEQGLPIDVRVGRHIAVVTRLIEAYTELNPDNPITISNLPSHADLVANGVGYYLLPAE